MIYHVTFQSAKVFHDNGGLCIVDLANQTCASQNSLFPQ